MEEQEAEELVPNILFLKFLKVSLGVSFHLHFVTEYAEKEREATSDCQTLLCRKQLAQLHHGLTNCYRGSHTIGAYPGEFVMAFSGAVLGVGHHKCQVIPRWIFLPSILLNWAKLTQAFSIHRIHVGFLSQRQSMPRAHTARISIQGGDSPASSISLSNKPVWLAKQGSNCV